jgi:hypothetical protein
MKRLFLAAIVVAAGIASAYAGGNLLLHVGQSDSNGTPAPCIPGASSGQLDFSVCSNIIYVPALIH